MRGWGGSQQDEGVVVRLGGDEVSLGGGEWVGGAAVCDGSVAERVQGRNVSSRYGASMLVFVVGEY